MPRIKFATNYTNFHELRQLKDKLKKISQIIINYHKKLKN